MIANLQNNRIPVPPVEFLTGTVRPRFQQLSRAVFATRPSMKHVFTQVSPVTKTTRKARTERCAVASLLTQGPHPICAQRPAGRPVFLDQKSRRLGREHLVWSCAPRTLRPERKEKKGRPLVLRSRRLYALPRHSRPRAAGRERDVNRASIFPLYAHAMCPKIYSFWPTRLLVAAFTYSVACMNSRFVSHCCSPLAHITRACSRGEAPALHYDAGSYKVFAFI